MEYKPCKLTIKATALGILPIYYEHFISIENTKKLMVFCAEAEDEKQEFNNLLNSIGLSIKEYYSVKELISILDFAIWSGQIFYQKHLIKNHFFIKLPQN